MPRDGRGKGSRSERKYAVGNLGFIQRAYTARAATNRSNAIWSYALGHSGVLYTRRNRASGAAFCLDRPDGWHIGGVLSGL